MAEHLGSREEKSTFDLLRSQVIMCREKVIDGSMAKPHERCSTDLKGGCSGCSTAVLVCRATNGEAGEKEKKSSNL